VLVNGDLLFVDMCVGSSSAACFVERAEEEEKANDTGHVQVKENQNEVLFVGLRVYTAYFETTIMLLCNKWFNCFLIRSYKSRFRTMNDGNIRRWKEGKRHNAHLKV